MRDKIAIMTHERSIKVKSAVAPTHTSRCSLDNAHAHCMRCAQSDVIHMMHVCFAFGKPTGTRRPSVRLGCLIASKFVSIVKIAQRRDTHVLIVIFSAMVIQQLAWSWE
jgi:hypothetical protein